MLRNTDDSDFFLLELLLLTLDEMRDTPKQTVPSPSPNMSRLSSCQHHEHNLRYNDQASTVRKRINVPTRDPPLHV